MKSSEKRTKLNSFLEEKYLVEGARIAVALSGGADSVCLLCLLDELSKEKKFSLYALHLNHMIRGEEADRDEEFCRNLCERKNITFFAERIDVPILAKKSGKSLEEAARDARYSFFERVMRKENIEVIASAHNADDLAENILIRLTRGTSLDGICGIPSERKLEYGCVIRPILHLSKSEILNFCERAYENYVTDSTNLSSEYTRNKIRNKVIPILREINPSFLEVQKRNASLFSQDADYINENAEKLLLECKTDECLLLSPMKQAHSALVTRVLNKYCIEKSAFPEKEHITLLLEEVKNKRNFSLSLPGKKRALIEEEKLFIIEDKREKRIIPEYSIELHEGKNELILPESDLCVTAFLREAEEGEALIFSEEKYALRQSLIYNLSTHKVLNFDKIYGKLSLRNRREGDRIDFGSFGKSVKKLMNEKKIPENLRPILPCLAEDGEIIYLPFAGCARKCTPNSESRRLYILDLKIKFNTSEE